jgi:hypothetical protein
MRKTFLTLSVILSSLLVVQCNSGEKALHGKLSEMARELNASTPVMLDRYTRFDEASVTQDNVFRYRYTVLNTANPDSLVQHLSQSLTENIRKEFSANPQLRIFRDNHVSIEYIYQDEDNRMIRTLRIEPKDYQ